MKNNITVVLIWVVLAVAGWYITTVSLSTDSHDTLARVIDGDTFVTTEGETIRLMGINTPEKNHCFHKESTDALESMLEWNKLSIIRMGQDKYNRTLGFVYVGEHNVNIIMVRAGFAESMKIQDHPYEYDILEAEHKSITWKQWMWKECREEFNYLQIPTWNN